MAKKVKANSLDAAVAGNTVLETAVSAAKKAANLVLFQWDELKIDFKSVNDLVTQADVASEKLIVETISGDFPEHQFYGEESEERADLNSDHLWIIDPLDGTTNFSSQIPHFSISIAYAQKGKIKVGVVYDVVKDELFYAVKGKGAFLNGIPIAVSEKTAIDQSIIGTGFAYERGDLMVQTLRTIQRLFENNIRGIRRFGSAALDLCWVACGRFDGFFEYKQLPYDFAAGVLILQEAGGKIVNHFGEPFSLDATGIIVSTPNIFKPFVALTRYGDGATD